MGAGVPRKQRELREGSRHVPVEVARAVWQRDASQCTFVDAEGRRCSERRFITLEHRRPFARGGAPTPENLCLLCSSHNSYTADLAFGAEHIARKRRERRPQAPPRRQGADSKHVQTDAQTQNRSRVLSALCNLGFARREALVAVETIASDIDQDCATMLRVALARLTPSTVSRRT
ncbi:MAG: hypothetical protein ACOY0T_01105 [Myxococcota bacterium]